MAGIARIGVRRASARRHCAEVGKTPPTLNCYTGLKFIAALGENRSRARNGTRKRLVAPSQISEFEMLRLQRPARRYEGAR